MDTTLGPDLGSAKGTPLLLLLSNCTRTSPYPHLGPLPGSSLLLRKSPGSDQKVPRAHLGSILLVIVWGRRSTPSLPSATRKCRLHLGPHPVDLLCCFGCWLSCLLPSNTSLRWGQSRDTSGLPLVQSHYVGLLGELPVLGHLAAFAPHLLSLGHSAPAESLAYLARVRQDWVFRVLQSARYTTVSRPSRTI